MPSLIFQPLDKQQALVRRESVVNMQNFKRQYARRRWKVWQAASHPACVGLMGICRQGQGYTYKIVRCFRQIKCILMCLYWCFHILILPSIYLQLSYSIVSLCNHLSRSLVKKALIQDECLVGTFFKGEENAILLWIEICKMSVVWGGKPGILCMLLRLL